MPGPNSTKLTTVSLNRLALPFDVFFEDLSELRPGGRRLRKYDPCGGRYRDEDTSDLQQLTTNECHNLLPDVARTGALIANTPASIRNSGVTNN